MDAWGEQHHVRIRVLARGDMPERGEQVGGIGVDRAHAAGAEKLGEDSLHRGAVLEHIRDPGRAAAVVFEDEVASVAVADEVRAADVDIGVLGYRDPHELRAIVGGPEDDLRRDHAVLDDALLVVDVVEEKVQGGDALHQSGFDLLPLAGWDDPRERVEGEDPLRPLFVAVDREGDALLEEQQFEAPEFLAELLVAEAREFFGHAAIVRANLSVLIDQLIEEVGAFVVGQDHA
jgi:hypothetical protein